MKKEALFYDKLDESKVQCRLCPHKCKISESKTGICNVRKNIDGKLYSLNYEKVTSIAIDPIEKKPLYHFYPETEILSLGTFGCNFSCDFCQNWQISQNVLNADTITSDSIVEILRTKAKNSIGVAYTYSEPTVWYEYVLETARKVKKYNKDKKNVLVTNGFINRDPLLELFKYVDALNIDLKAFKDSFYKKLCNGRIEPVKESIKMSYENGKVVEVTNLIVTNENDDLNEIKDLISFIASISKDIPLHFSRYYPNYKMENRATDEKLMYDVYKIAKERLNYVYLGNIRTDLEGDTFCPNCKENIVKRNYYSVSSQIRDSKCPNCGSEIYGEFK